MKENKKLLDELEIYTSNCFRNTLYYIFIYKGKTYGIFNDSARRKLVLTSYYTKYNATKLEPGGWKRTMAMNDLRKLKKYLTQISEILKV